MKRIIMIFCLSLTLSSVCQANETKKLEERGFATCGETRRAYANLTEKDSFNVTIAVADRCTGEDSRLILRNKQGNEVKAINVPDSGDMMGIDDETFVTFLVAPGESIWLECNGTGFGGCASAIFDVSLRGKR